MSRRHDRGLPEHFYVRDWDARDDEWLKRELSQFSHRLLWLLALSMPRDDEPQPSTDD